jgi:glutathione S-transferase
LASQPKARLLTIRFSHFCEKGRWACDRAGLAYTEEFHAPLFHVAPVRRVKGARTTPVLLLPDRALTDSTDILKYCDARGADLYPADPTLRKEVEDWEEHFDETLGPAVRRMVYFNLFQLPSKFLVDLFESAATPGERRWVGATFPVVRFLMKKGMKIDAAGAERSRLRVEEVTARVEGLLSDGRRYLVGDRFTAADLTFAALYAPFTGPPEYGAPLPGFADLPEPFAPLRDTMTARPAGQYTQRMFREHRRGVSASSPRP